ncbi:VOC family protein [Xenophilus arseniciresistens]|uniref:VOC family protein n=1 Tax=Xenophilus arseniciresistens TaxID=1283306 RepID=A0AAE3T163_9BURK|nr:VOC family protein [Xenophilus arseniciresistens]MDA7417037.1 VOC family protein [Xenophilus arseniciresistens]
MAATLDHLVIAAHTLEAGVRWCEATLGLTPDAGGSHPQMGTHNRLLNISSPPDWPRTYLEIIAIDPAARPPLAPGQRRWFDLDEAALQTSLARDGAALIHFVARTNDADELDACTQALAALKPPVARGPAVAMHRDTPTGRVHWQITLREDGQRLCQGALPTLIARDGPAHPCDRLPDHGLRLRTLHARHPEAATLAPALHALGLHAVTVQAGRADLVAELDTPRGPVTLHSSGR